MIWSPEGILPRQKKVRRRPVEQPGVPQEPNVKQRMCRDPKDRNKFISGEHHVIPSLKEILPRLSGAKYFSIVHEKCGYWSAELDRESSYLTTFNVPFYRYRFLRMPFGLKMSQNLSHAKIDRPLNVVRIPSESLMTLSFLESQNRSTIIIIVCWQDVETLG